MKYKSIKLYKSTFCRDCIIADRFFEENNINIQETVNIDNDEKAAQFVQEVNGGFRSVPTIVIEMEDTQNLILVEPTWEELKLTFQ